MTQHWKHIPLYIDYCYSEQFNGRICMILENEWSIEGRSTLLHNIPAISKKIILFGKNGEVSKRVNCTGVGYPQVPSIKDELLFNQYLEKKRIRWKKYIYNELNKIIAVEDYLGVNRVDQYRTWKYEYDAKGVLKRRHNDGDSYTEYKYYENGKLKEVNNFAISPADDKMACSNKKLYTYANNQLINCKYYSIPNSDTGSEDISKPLELVAKSSQLIDYNKMVITTENYDRNGNYLSTSIEHYNEHGDRLEVKSVRADEKPETGIVSSFKYDDKNNWIEKLIGNKKLIRRNIEYSTDS